jgi:hypothetical protein
MDNTIEKAKEYISDYFIREFDDYDDSDFSDLHNVPLAYTTLTDEEIPINVKIDLINMEFKTYINEDFENPVVVEKTELETLKWLDFDMLIAGWQGYIEAHMEEYIGG